jgi:hypothetical protein
MGRRSRPFLLEGGLLPFVAGVLDQHVDDAMVFLATVVTTVSTLSLAEMDRESILVSKVIASLGGVAPPSVGVSLFLSLSLAECRGCTEVVVADGAEVGDINVETAVGGERFSLGTCTPLWSPKFAGG